MIFHCTVRDAQLIRDLLIRFLLQQEAEHLPLPRREVITFGELDENLLLALLLFWYRKIQDPVNVEKQKHRRHKQKSCRSDQYQKMPGQCKGQNFSGSIADAAGQKSEAAQRYK